MKSLLIIFMFIISSTVHSQNTGLYGKKWCFDIGGTGTIPLLSILDGPIYKSKNGNLEEKMDVFDYGIRTGVSYALSNNFSMGFEFDMEFSNIAAPTSIEVLSPFGGVDYMAIEHETLRTRSLIFMPRMSFTSKNGLLPIGLSHQIGVGFSRTKIIEKDYDYVLHQSSGAEISDFDERFYDYTNEPFKGLVIMYTLNVRTPINKFMMITYGVRYNFNYGFEPNYSASNSNDSFYLGEAFANDIVKRRRFRSLLSFNLGVAFAL